MKRGILSNTEIALVDRQVLPSSLHPLFRNNIGTHIGDRDITTSKSAYLGDKVQYVIGTKFGDLQLTCSHILQQISVPLTIATVSTNLNKFLAAKSD